jgi:hypothetical protein
MTEHFFEEYRKHLCGFNEQFERDLSKTLLEEFENMVELIYDRMFDGSAHGLYLEDQFTKKEFLKALLDLRAENLSADNLESVWFNQK